MNEQPTPKVICLNCQAFKDHCTAKCPYIKCKSCKKQGHVYNECPKKLGHVLKKLEDTTPHKELSCSDSMPVFLDRVI